MACAETCHMARSHSGTILVRIGNCLPIGGKWHARRSWLPGGPPGDRLANSCCATRRSGSPRRSPGLPGWRDGAASASLYVCAVRSESWRQRAIGADTVSAQAWPWHGRQELLQLSTQTSRAARRPQSLRQRYQSRSPAIDRHPGCQSRHGQPGPGQAAPPGPVV